MGDPRDPAEWLALGATHPVDPQNVGRSTAPIRWESSDAGFALAGLPNHLVWLLRAKYMGDMTDYHALLVEVAGNGFNEMSRLKVGAGLTVDEVRRISRAALQECMDPGKCLTCAGRASAKVGDKVIQCPSCRGLGRVELSDRRLSEISGISRRRVQNRDCMRLFGLLLSLLSAWESTGLGMVRNRIRQGGTLRDHANEGAGNVAD